MEAIRAARSWSLARQKRLPSIPPVTGEISQAGAGAASARGGWGLRREILKGIWGTGGVRMVAWVVAFKKNAYDRLGQFAFQ